MRVCAVDHSMQCRNHQLAAAGRVFRLQGSYFQERCLLAPLKRGWSQKNLFIWVQRKVAHGWHAIAQPASINRLLRAEFYDFLFKYDNITCSRHARMFISRVAQASLHVAGGGLLICRPLRWFESVSQIIAACIKSAGCCVILDNYSMVLHQVST